MQLDRGGICHLLMLRHLRHFTRGTSGSVQNTLYVEWHWLRYRLDGTVALELQYRLDDFCGGNRNYTSAFDRCRSMRARGVPMLFF